jgi:hypothetical protein
MFGEHYIYSYWIERNKNQKNKDEGRKKKELTADLMLSQNNLTAGRGTMTP